MPRHPLLVLALVALALPAAAQETPDEQARRLLEDGRAYRAQGKPKQALDNFTIVVTSFPATDSVGQALLEIGRYRMEVEGDAEKARAAFEQVTKQYARSDAAPGAYHYLGLLTLQRATTAAEIDDALAQFARVETLYPSSAWVPRSLQASGLAYRRAGRYAEAADLNRRVVARVPRLRRGRRRPVRDRAGPRPPGSAAPRDGGVPAGAQPLPPEPVGAAGPRAHDRALPPLRGDEAGVRGGPLLLPRRRRRAEGRASARGGPRRHPLDRLGQDPQRGSLRRLRQDGSGPDRRGAAGALADSRRRARPCLARRRTPRGEGHPHLHDPAGEGGRDAEAGRQDPRRRGHSRRARSSSPTRTARRSCATTRRASTSASSRKETRRSARSPASWWTARAAS